MNIMNSDVSSQEIQQYLSNFDTSFSQTHLEPFPLRKLAKILSPVEIFTPIFVPAENNRINKSPLQYIMLFFPSPLNSLTRKQRNSNRHPSKTLEYQPPSSFGPLLLPSLGDKIAPGQ
uniref:Uncharacterized protein n=1 Tax=Clytia hemisphaerica TaxID=252671 RepID=A0A7M5VBH6_9CNID|eukprot:TCONS_00032576-protein